MNLRTRDQQQQIFTSDTNIVFSMGDSSDYNYITAENGFQSWRELNNIIAKACDD